MYLVFDEEKIIRTVPGLLPLSKLEMTLVQKCLADGFFPLPSSVRSGYKKELYSDSLKEVEYDYAVCMCAYVGKDFAEFIKK